MSGWMDGWAGNPSVSVKAYSVITEISAHVISRHEPVHQRFMGLGDPGGGGTSEGMTSGANTRGTALSQPRPASERGLLGCGSG